MDTIEGNKLIAEFMGGKRVKRPDRFTNDYGFKFKQRPDSQDNRESAWWEENSLEYHTSWDWLMPVVEKIESMNYRISILLRCCDISELIGLGNIIEITAEETKIKAVWIAVVDFIKWHNENNNNGN